MTNDSNDGGSCTDSCAADTGDVPSAVRSRSNKPKGAQGMESAKRKRLTLRGKLVAASGAMAGVLLMSSVAWACTTQPGMPDEIQAIHCMLLHPGDPNCDPDSEPNAVSVFFQAHGSGLLYNGKTVPVYQDDDDTNINPGAFMSAIGGCEGGDPPRGEVTYGRQTVGNSRVGTGYGVLVATDGPGLYGICAGPADAISALGQFLFV